MNKRRLLKLADLLEADAKKRDGIKFDLQTWGKVENEDRPISCGTTACAAGLAAISGVFKRQGLGYRIERDDFWERDEVRITLNGRCRNSQSFDGSFISTRNFFGLTTRQAEWIFTPYEYEGPTTGAAGERAVAKRIRKFVAADGALSKGQRAT